MLKDKLNFQFSPLIITMGIAFISGIIGIYSHSFLLGLIIFLLLLPLVIKRPFLVIWAAFFTYALWPYIKFYLHIYLPIGMVFISIFGFFYLIKLVKFLVTKRGDYRLLLIDILCIMFISIGAILFLLSNDKRLAIIGFKENLRMCFLFLFVRAIKPTHKQLSTFLNIFLFVAIIVSAYGIYQYFFDYYSLIDKFGGVASLSERYFGMSESLRGHLGARRAYSLFLNNFTLAYYLMITLIILQARYMIYRKMPFGKLNYIFLPIILLCFILTFTRGAWMGFLIASLFMIIINKNLGLLKKGLSILPMIIAIAIILVFFLPSDLNVLIKDRFLSIFSTDSTQTSGHYEYLKENLRLTVDRPLGIGLGKGTAYIGEVWNESSIFKIITEMGIFPGILYLLIFIITIIKGIPLFHNTGEKKQKEIILITSGVSLGYLVSGLIFPIWFTWFPTMVVWLFMGVLFNFVEEPKWNYQL